MTSLNRVTLITFVGKFLQRMSEKYGGESTVNEMRVIHTVYACSFHDCEEDGHGVTWIAETTGIPIPTVSRSVANLIAKGWLVERSHPTDGRRRVIVLSEKAMRHRDADVAKFLSTLEGE